MVNKRAHWCIQQPIYKVQERRWQSPFLEPWSLSTIFPTTTHGAGRVAFCVSSPHQRMYIGDRKWSAAWDSSFEISFYSSNFILIEVKVDEALLIPMKQLPRRQGQASYSFFVARPGRLSFRRRVPQNENLDVGAIHLFHSTQAGKQIHVPKVPQIPTSCHSQKAEEG